MLQQKTTSDQVNAFVARGIFLLTLSVLPIAGTVGLRNTCLVVMAIVVILGLFSRDTPKESRRSLIKNSPLFLLLLAAYLFLFPLWAVEPSIALSNLLGQWCQTLLSWLLGLAVAVLFAGRLIGLVELGLSSFVLVGIYLMLLILNWFGCFGNAFDSMSSAEPSAIFDNFVNNWRTVTGTDMLQRLTTFPWGFRGFDPDHGNLGAACLQSSLLFIAAITVRGLGQSSRRRAALSLGLLLCLSSILIASSRGSVIYGVLLLLIAIALHSLCAKWDIALDSGVVGRAWQSNFALMAGLCLALILGVCYVASKDQKWTQMQDKLKMAGLVESPIGFICEGLSSKERDSLLSSIPGTEPGLADQYLEGLRADGGRLIHQRAGAQLLIEHPFGYDGSRQAFSSLMLTKCGHPPVNGFAHTHSGWINMSLSVGIPGALLYFALLLQCCVQGLRSMRLSDERRYFGYALALLSLFWVLRAATDAVLQDHYLLMQGLLLGFLWGRARLPLSQSASHH